MANEIIATPNPLPLVSGLEGLLLLGGQVLYPSLPQGSFPERFSVSPDLQWQSTLPDSPLKKVGGVDGGSSPVTMIQAIPKEQSFWTHGSPGRITSGFQSFHIGVFDNFNRFSGFFAQANPGGQFDSWGVGAQVQGVNVGGEWGTPFGKLLPAYVGLNVNIENNQIVLRYEVAAGVFEVARVTIPAEVTDFRTHYNLWRIGTTMYFTQTRVDEAIVPIRSNNINIEQIPPNWASVRSVNASHLGVTGSGVGDYVLRLSHPYVAFPLDVVCQVAALYIRPVGGACGGVAIQGTTVQFESNGGQGGIFTATGGTILSGLKWQAPYGTGIVDFLYTIGAVSAGCQLWVVPKLIVEGVDDDGYYPDIAQGETVSFKASCEGATYRSPYMPYLVSRRGVLTAPLDAHDEVFGEKIVLVRVTGCGQVYEFKVRIQAMYPTPQFCGPIPQKWLGNEPDFLATSSTMTGGTSQVKNRNGLGILTWEVQYQTLKQTAIIGGCSCVTEEHAKNCKPHEETAQRLSDFYRYVSTAKYFSMVDYHTGITYKFVRLTEFSRDHVIYETEQSRRLRMRYEGIPLYALLPQPTVPSIGDGDTEPIAPPLGEWEQVVKDFILITGITDPSIGDLLNDFIIRLRTDHLWDNLDAIYPFVGGTAHAHKFNLKDPRDHDAAFRLTMAGTWLHGERGVKPDGLTAYGNTHYIPPTHGEPDNHHLSFYSLTDEPSGQDISIDQVGIAKRHIFAVKWASSGNVFFVMGWANVGTSLSWAGQVGYGFFTHVRESLSRQIVYLNGAKGAEDTGGSPDNSGVTLPYYIAASNYNTGTPTDFSSRQCVFISIGTALLADDVAKLNGHVRWLQEQLGRAEMIPTYWVLPIADASWRFNPTNPKMPLEALANLFYTQSFDTILKFTKLGEWVEFQSSTAADGGAAAVSVFIRDELGNKVTFGSNGTVSYEPAGGGIAYGYFAGRPDGAICRITRISGSFFTYSVEGSTPQPVPWVGLREEIGELDSATPLLTGAVTVGVTGGTALGVKVYQPWTNIGTVVEGAWTPQNLAQAIARYLWNDILGKQDGDLMIDWVDSILTHDFYYLGSTAWSPIYREAGYVEFNNNGMVAGGSTWNFGDCAFYLVFRMHNNPTSDNLWDRILDKSSLGGMWFGRTGTVPGAGEVGGGFVGGAPDYGTFLPFVEGQWYAAVIQRDGSRQFVHLGANTEAEACSPAVTDGTQLFLGCESSYGNTGKFDIKELVVCNNNLSPQDMLNLSTYSQDVYGLTFGDVNILTFLANTGITDSVLIAALYELVADLKAAGVWDKCQGIYPMAGGTAQAHKFNLKNPADTDAAFRMTLAGNWVHDATGATPDGGTAYGDSHLIPATHGENNSVHLSFFSLSQQYTGSAEWGTSNSSDTFLSFAMFNYYVGYQMYSDCYYNGGLNRLTGAVVDGWGFGITTRTASTEHNIYKDGVLIGTDNDPNTLTNASLTFPLCLAGVNSSAGVGSLSQLKCSFASVGKGLTNDEVIPYNAAVYKFVAAKVANVFFKATGITNPIVQTAIHNLVKGLMRDGLWNKIHAIYPMAGGTAQAHKFNLKDPRDLDAALRLTFFGTITHDSYGATSDGSTGYANTNLLMSTTVLNNFHQSYYSGTNIVGISQLEMGVSDGVYAIQFCLAHAGLGNQAFSDLYSDTNRCAGAPADGDTTGYYLATRTSDVAHVFYKDGTGFASSAIPVAHNPSGMGNMMLMGYNPSNNTGILCSPRRCQFATLGLGLSSFDVIKLSTLVNAFQTELGRNV